MNNDETPNGRQDPKEGFELDLLDRLKFFVGARGASLESEEATVTRSSTVKRFAPRLAIGGAVALAVAGGVLAVSAGSSSSSKAFAVETEPDGGTTITINTLEDASGLEAAFAEAGITSQVTWLAPGMVCSEPHFTPAPDGLSPRYLSFGHWNGVTVAPKPTWPAPAEAVTVTIGAQQAENGELPNGNVGVWSFNPAAFSADQTLVLYGSRTSFEGNPEAGWLANFNVAEGSVGPCEPVSYASENSNWPPAGPPPGN